MAKRRTRGGLDDAPQIPEMADEKDDALISAAKRYGKNKMQLKESASDLQASEEALLKLMHERGIQKYRYKDLEITIDLKEKAKVKTEPPEPSENGDDANDE